MVTKKIELLYLLIGILKKDAGKDTEMVKHLWQRRFVAFQIRRMMNKQNAIEVGKLIQGMTAMDMDLFFSFSVKIDSAESSNEGKQCEIQDRFFFFKR